MSEAEALTCSQLLITEPITAVTFAVGRAQEKRGTADNVTTPRAPTHNRRNRPQQFFFVFTEVSQDIDSMW